MIMSINNIIIILNNHYHNHYDNDYDNDYLI